MFTIVLEHDLRGSVTIALVRHFSAAPPRLPPLQ